MYPVLKSTFTLYLFLEQVGWTNWRAASKPLGNWQGQVVYRIELCPKPDTMGKWFHRDVPCLRQSIENLILKRPYQSTWFKTSTLNTTQQYLWLFSGLYELCPIDYPRKVDIYHITKGRGSRLCWKWTNNGCSAVEEHKRVSYLNPPSSRIRQDFEIKPVPLRVSYRKISALLGQKGEGKISFLQETGNCD